VKEQFPDLWDLEVFSAWEKVKEALPSDIVSQHRRPIYLQPFAGKTLVQAEVFFDTGNHVGPLISYARILQLGYTKEHINEGDMFSFVGAGGEVFTIGTIWLEYKTWKTGGAVYKGQESLPKKAMKFNVWEDRVGVADVLFGADEDSAYQPLDDGRPALLVLARGPPLTASESTRDKIQEGLTRELTL